ncbi:MAG TPA: aldo/keto reductase [Polyangiales bacterium]
MDSLTGELEWIDPKRTLRDLKAEDVARFGLDKPRYRVAFELAGSRVAFSVGSETPQGDGAYLQRLGRAALDALTSYAPLWRKHAQSRPMDADGGNRLRPQDIHALAWVLAQGNDVVPIPGTKRRGFLEENLKAAEIVLTPDELASITAVAPKDAAAGARYPDMSTVNR